MPSEGAASIGWDAAMRTVLVVGHPEAPDPSTYQPLLTTLVARGNRVVFLATEVHRATAAAAGAAFRVLPASPPRRTPDRGRNFVASVDDLIRHHFTDPFEAQWHATWQAIEAESADILLADALCIGACLIAELPRTRRPPVVVLGTIPPPHLRNDAAPFGLGLPPNPGLLNGARNWILRLAVRHLVLRPIMKDMRAIFRRVAGAEMAPDTYAAAHSADRWLGCAPERFAYPDTDPPANFRRIGPIALPAEAPLPGWWDPADHRPIIHVRGAAFLDPAVLLGPAMRVWAGDETVRVVVSGASRADVAAAAGGTVPAHVFVAEGLPAAQLLPLTAVAIMRGDSVSVHAALQQGVPVVAFGTDAAEAETAARLAFHGCGVRLRTDTPTAGMLRDAVDRVRSDPAMRLAAAAFAAEAARLDAEATIAEVVEDLVPAADDRPWSTDSARIPGHRR